MSIAEHLEVIQGFHRGCGDYGPSAGEAAHVTYLEAFGEPPPPELVTLHAVTTGGPFFGLELLSPEQVVAVRKDWDQVATEMTEDDADYVAYPADQVAKRYWQPGWVPFLNEDGGPHGFAIDTAPLAAGQVGQIVNYGPDEYDRFVCAPTLETFLARIAAEVRAGRVGWQDGFGQFQATANGGLLQLFTGNPSPAALVHEERRRRRNAARAARQAAPAAGTPAAADQEPLQIALHADGGIQTQHSSTSPAHMDTREVAQGWVREAAGQLRPIQISGPLAEPRVTSVVELLQAAAGSHPVTVTDETHPPLRQGWTTLMWAAAHGRRDLVQDLIDQGVDPTFAPRAFGGLYPGTSAYELAMAKGHVPVLQTLRGAGVPNPVRGRPPGGPEAIVLRTTSGTLPYRIAAVLVVIGLLLGLALQSWEASLTLGLMGVAVAVIGLVLNSVASGVGKIAVDGPLVWSQRNFGWQGPVDLRQVIAVGLQVSQNVRSPTLLRLGNTEHGFSVRKAAVRSGFDPDQVAVLTAQDAKVLTLSLSQRFFRPGLELYVGSQLDRARTTVSQSAMRFLFPRG